ncbi:metallophosphoesterase [Roseivivax sp. GX 12232]|uniref:metallophosphoesterase n=1 Tax=Roseivivax sp. GX 12232 TaxID=2900547 RepID=UPI00351D9A29
MIKSLLDRFRKPAGARFEPPAPEVPFAAVGDIHGRLDLLEELLPKLPQDLHIICVGDYVDRGPASVNTLRFLKDHPEILCLKGNHEDMLLDFIDRPDERGPRWLRNGGLQTLADIGVRGISETTQGEPLIEARHRMAEEMGAELISWVRELPLLHETGNVAVLHAGADPAKPLSAADKRTLIWGHRDFLQVPRQDGTWVVHGHTIVDAPSAEDGRVALDTGAYATGRLTAGIVEAGEVRFIST